MVIANVAGQLVTARLGARERPVVGEETFHMILADPREEVLEKEVPPLVKAGHASLKVFMTYDRLKVDDEQLLNVLQSARDNHAMVCVHAENHGMISWMGKRLLKHGHTAPKFHAISHPRLRAGNVQPADRLRGAGRPADHDLPRLDRRGHQVIRKARGEGLKVFAETCPQYLFMTRHDLDKPGTEGAKWIFSPPARDASDQPALWQALALGDLQVISSDHAPYRYDKSGKLMAGKKPNFKQIPNGMPGLEGAAAGGVRRDGDERPLRREQVRRVDLDQPGDRSTASIRRRARSRSARMPISRSGTRRRASPSRTRPSRTAPASRPGRAAP